MGERLQSPYDPEMHDSTKRQLAGSGYKVQVTETCDEDAAHLVTHVTTCPAMQQDMTSTAEIHAHLTAEGLLPAEPFVDLASVDAALLVSSRRDHDVSLEGPVRGVSNWQARADQGYDLPHFAIDWERDRVTCPQGKTSASWRVARADDGSPRTPAQFSRSDCRACAARAPCTPAKEARRTVHIHLREEHEALSAARARMHAPAWKQRSHVRTGVAGTLSQGGARSGCAGAATSGWPRPGSSRSAPPPR